MTTLDELKELLCERFEFEASAIDPDRSLIDSGLDSLSLAELMFIVEEHFDVELTPDQQGISTLAGLATAIDQLRMPQAA